MAHKSQPERWEATWLAVAMAVAGAPFLFDKLASLMRVGLASMPSFLHSSPVFLVGVGAILLFAEQNAKTRTTESDQGKDRGDRHDL